MNFHLKIKKIKNFGIHIGVSVNNREKSQFATETPAANARHVLYSLTINHGAWSVLNLFQLTNIERVPFYCNIHCKNYKTKKTLVFALKKKKLHLDSPDNCT